MKSRCHMIAAVVCLLLIFGVLTQWSKANNTTFQGEMGFQVTIVPGEHYTHKLKIFPFIKIKAAPQIAIWVEDLDGNYIDTLYVTNKVVKQNWSKAPGDSTPKDQIQRKEALPYWTHKWKANVENVDQVASATPKKESSFVREISELGIQEFVVVAEFNNSTDFNEYYSNDAKPGAPFYSGGAWGSGQPAIIYAVKVNLDSPENRYHLYPIGHSSPDGTDGNLYTDLSYLTTAKYIVTDVIVELTH